VDISFGQLFSVPVAGLDWAARQQGSRQHKLASEPGTCQVMYLFLSAMNSVFNDKSKLLKFLLTKSILCLKVIVSVYFVKCL
jgi:hypothetical protein